MSAVKFWALLDNKIIRVSGQLEDPLVDFFKCLRNDVDVAGDIPANLAYGDCKFYRLKKPVLVAIPDDNDAEREDEREDDQQDGAEDFLEQVKQACREEANRVRVNPITTKVGRLARQFSADRAYLVIDFSDPFGDSNRAIGRLRQDHDTLFKCLQVTVGTLGKWHPGDVERNLQGGILTEDVNGLPSEFREIQEALARKRVYQPEDEQKRDFQNARTYQTQFNRVFELGDTDSHTAINDREFAAFYNVLRCYHSDVSLITAEVSSSALKASNFTVHFIQPPFFSEIDNSSGFEYHQKKSWSFPVFVDTASARNAWRKFTPRSDWMVIALEHKIPFVISEVISQAQQSDRSRMLVQAIALARAGNFLLKSASKKTFFIVAIYVAADMVASRYIVMQTGRGDATQGNNLYRNKTVCIHRKDFDLTENVQEVDFQCEMYNLATQITTLSRDLDQLKKDSLTDIKALARKVLSLSSRAPQPATSGNTIMESITEGAEGPDGPQDEDDIGVFAAEDIQNVLRQMNYKIKFILWGHPQLAAIVSNTGDKHGYLKFVEREREVKVLQFLTEIESPSNHTISCVRFWPVQGGTVISMPVAGGWLTSLDKPDKQLWPVALQLFEAVAFMHEHNVAHMDLKPQNVIIPSEGGRLSIIDFSVSISVRGPDVKYRGVAGTEDYMAPEVRKGQYKPILADLWSCGRTLEELCSCCASSSIRTTLLDIAQRLMNRDPEARPMMSTVLEWLAPTQRRMDTAVSPKLGSFQTAMLLAPE